MAFIHRHSSTLRLGHSYALTLHDYQSSRFITVGASVSRVKFNNSLCVFSILCRCCEFSMMHPASCVKLHSVSLTWVLVSKLFAHHSGLSGVPSIVGHSPPHPIDTHLHSFLVTACSTNQVDVAIAETLR